MPYNPGVQDMSGQLRAQGRLAQVQGVASGLSSGFESYQQNKIRNQTLQGENEGLVNVFMRDEETKKYAPAGMEKLLQKAASGGGMTLDDNIRLNGMLNSAIKTRGVIDQQNQAAADAGYRKAAADRLAEEDARLQEFRKSLATDYDAGVRNLNDYNTYAGIQESLRNINAPSTIGAGAVPQTTGPASGMNRPQPVFGSQLPPALPEFDARMSPSASGLNGSVPPALSRFEPAPMQINAPQSVFGLDQSKVRQAPPSAEFDTPEKIANLIYDYTPGSGSAVQENRAYRGLITPELIQRGKQIQVQRDSAAATDARARAVAIAAEQRRREADARRQATDAQNAINAVYAANADARGEAAEARAANPNLTIEQVLMQKMGADKKREIASMQNEIRGDPIGSQITDALMATNYVVDKATQAKIEKSLKASKLTPQTQAAIRSLYRVSN